MLIGLGLLIPFLGTSFGAAAVFFIKKELGIFAGKLLSGFAAGVMFAASVWSLIIPAIELSGQPKWLETTAGFSAGVIFLILSERLIENINRKKKSGLLAREKSMLVFAVTLHNIPEGMAVGVGFAGAIRSNNKAMLAAAFALSLGIAIQNIPEGAIISMPLKAQGKSRLKSFCYGALSGAVEPIAAAFSLALSSAVSKLMPLFLSFAAGAMVCVCVNELIPESKFEGKVNIGLIGFSLGFLIMMILDVALG